MSGAYWARRQAPRIPAGWYLCSETNWILRDTKESSSSRALGSILSVTSEPSGGFEGSRLRECGGRDGSRPLALGT